MRDLEWEGCWNARDLGGLPTCDGGRTLRARVVRSNAPDGLSEVAWRKVVDHGVRSIIDLRNPEQVGVLRAAVPIEISIQRCPIEAGLESDPRFVKLTQSGAWATSSYLAAFLLGWPGRVARVLELIANAPPGAVLVHCRKGSDRTGLISLALLAEAGVEPDAIVADYERTAVRLREHGVRCGWADDGEALARIYEHLGGTPRAGVLEALEVWRTARRNMPVAVLKAVRRRLLER